MIQEGTFHFLCLLTQPTHRKRTWNMSWCTYGSWLSARCYCQPSSQVLFVILRFLEPPNACHEFLQVCTSTGHGMMPQAVRFPSATSKPFPKMCLVCRGHGQSHWLIWKTRLGHAVSKFTVYVLVGLSKMSNRIYKLRTTGKVSLWDETIFWKISLHWPSWDCWRNLFCFQSATEMSITTI